MTERVSRHPSVETMAAFVEGMLTSAETSVVAEHLRECAGCRTVAAGTAEFGEEAAHREGNARWGLLAAAIAIAVLTVPLLMRRGTNDPASILIAAAPKEHRRIDARIAGFPWAAFEAQQRGSGVADPADLKLGGAAGEVLERTAAKNDAASLHGRGVALLLIDRIPEGTAVLERAANGSSDARIWNDLAAARYALVSREERLAQLPLALAAADRALVLDPRLAEAHFNRALILQRMGLQEQARKSWDSYLALDPHSAWSLEARARLRRIGGGKPVTDFRRAIDGLAPGDLVRQFPQESRTWGEGILLAEWADTEGTGDVALANAKLQRIRAIGSALAAASGEHLLDDAVGAIERADAPGRMALAEAHRTYRDGRVLFRDRKDRMAEERFRRAEELFRGRSPMEYAAAYYTASATFHQNRVGEAYDALLRLAPRIDGTRYRALTAQLHWELAVHANIDADWGAAVRESATAARIYEDLRERANEADLRVLAAPALEALGDPDLAWKERLTAIETVSSRHRERVLHAAAEALAARGEVAAAAAVLDATIGEMDAGQPLLAFMLGDRARLAARSGDAAGAVRWLDGARAAASKLPAGGLRDVATARVLLAETVATPSVASSDRVIALFAAQKHGGLLPDAYLQRSRAHRIAGDDLAALTDYAAAFGEIERQQQSVGDPRQPGVLDTAGEIVDEAIALRLARGEIAEAFRVADRTRSIRNVDPRVPHGAALLEYAVLPHAIAIFCVTEMGMSAATVPAERRDVADGVLSFAQKIRGRAPMDEVAAAGAGLYRWLIAPVGGRLTNATELVIVPDHELYGVPFAALFDAQHGRYLAEEFTIRFASSAAAFEKQSSISLSPAFVVADPVTQHWPRLPYSREEAERIASLYDATLIAGQEATPARFSAAARDGALIHYAGHADSDARESYGALLLAGPTGAFGVRQVAGLSLRHHPLVVLAACGTFRGDVRHVAGMPSLARAFLTAGARAVVGTLWEIDDEMSAALFLRFHEQLHAGASPATALRAAQLEMLRSPDPRWKHPASWSPHAVLSNQSGESI